MQILEVISAGNWWPLAEGCVPSDQFVAGKTLLQCQEALAPSNASLYQNSWVSQRDWELLSGAGRGAVLLDKQGERLGWLDDGPGPSVSASADSFLLLYHWDLLKVHEQPVGGLPEHVHIGPARPAAHIGGTLHVGTGSRSFPARCPVGHVSSGGTHKM